MTDEAYDPEITRWARRESEDTEVTIQLIGGNETCRAIPPADDCQPWAYCPFISNGAYHGACLWHEGPGRTCTCEGRTAHPGVQKASAQVHEAWEDTVTLSVPAIHRLLDERVEKETPNAAEALRFFVRQMMVKAVVRG